MPYANDTPPSSAPSRTPSPPPSKDPEVLAQSRRRHDHHESEIVIVGAGIFGTALAIAFARHPQNRSVTLLEKSLKEPDRIVGELLQPGGVSALKRLGLSDCLEDIDSVRVKGYEVIYYGERVQIPYPQNAGETEEGAEVNGESGRPEGKSFHHGRLIRRLREAALQESNISVVESTVTGIIKDTYTGQIVGVESMTNEKKDAWFGQLTVAADGYASKFRKEVVSKPVMSKSKFWGLELIDADLPRPEHGHVVLGDGAPMLLYQIGTHETRALIDIPDGLESAQAKNGGVKGHLRKVVLPSIPKSVQPSFERALDEGKLRSMPNSFLPPSLNKLSGFVVLGDAMNMRHPLTGGGMTVAFNDVVMLRDLLSHENVPDFGNTQAVQKQMKVFHWRRKNLTSVINILAQALYSLFAANGEAALMPASLSTLTCDRSTAESSTTWLLQILPAWRSVRRWARWPLSWNHSPTFGALLPLLLRCTPGNLDSCQPVSSLHAPVDVIDQHCDIHQGLHRHLSVHLFGTSELMEMA